MDADALAELVAEGEVAVLSGAGLSTDSGIPDYRGATGSRRRSAPMTYADFTSGAAARQRYWARSHLGWPTVADAAPNAGHVAVTALQREGLLAGILTQNVDGLHTAAGATDVLELHGNLARVVCLSCSVRSARSELDLRLREANPRWVPTDGRIQPDGDVELPDAAVTAFRVVACGACGGVLKPDVVFFGETVPRDRGEAGVTLVHRARLLLVLGSSLTVMSGYRFVLRAARIGVPVAIVTQGATRGDAYAALRLDAPLGEVLPQLAYAAAGRASPRRSLVRSPVTPARTDRRPGPNT